MSTSLPASLFIVLSFSAALQHRLRLPDCCLLCTNSANQKVNDPLLHYQPILDVDRLPTLLAVALPTLLVSAVAALRSCCQLTPALLCPTLLLLQPPLQSRVTAAASGAGCKSRHAHGTRPGSRWTGCVPAGSSSRWQPGGCPTSSWDWAGVGRSAGGGPWCCG